MLRLLLVLLVVVAACGDNDEPPIDAGCSVDACICQPEWPGCPPGCSPPIDAGAP